MPCQRFTIGGGGYLERNEYEGDRKDWRWQLGANASYQPLRWLGLSFEYFYRESDSNQDLDDYKENRLIFRINLSI